MMTPHFGGNSQTDTTWPAGHTHALRTKGMSAYELYITGTVYHGEITVLMNTIKSNQKKFMWMLTCTHAGLQKQKL